MGWEGGSMRKNVILVLVGAIWTAVLAVLLFNSRQLLLANGQCIRSIHVPFTDSSVVIPDYGITLLASLFVISLALEAILCWLLRRSKKMTT
jgi:hypothetical protein